MLSEDYIVFNSYDVVRIVRVILLQVHQDLQLDTCLMLEAFLVSDKFDCHIFLSLMIEAFQSLSEAAFT